MKKMDDVSLPDYLLKIRALTDTLIGSKSMVTDCEIIGYALNRLPIDFSPFSTMVNMQRGLSYNDEYHDLLIAEDLFIHRRTLE